MNKTFILFILMLNGSLLCAQQKAAVEVVAYVEVNNHVMNQDGPTPRTIASARATAAQDIRLINVSNFYKSTSTYYQLTPFFKNSGHPRSVYNATPIKNVNKNLSKLLNDAIATAKTESHKYPKTKTMWHYHADKSLTLANQISLNTKVEAEVIKETEKPGQKRKSAMNLREFLKQYGEDPENESHSSASDGANADANENDDQDDDAEGDDA